MALIGTILLVTLLVLLLLGGWMLSLLGLFGTWVIVGVMATWTAFAPVDDPLTTTWTLVIILTVLALLGEGIEFIAGVAGSAGAGASRRGMVLSVIGGVVGGSIGLSLGTALLPVIGSIAGTILLGGAGSMGGALLGEWWKGSADSDQTKRIGKAAFWGRVLGTVAKSSLCTLMLFISIGSLFFSGW